MSRPDRHHPRSVRLLVGTLALGVLAVATPATSAAATAPTTAPEPWAKAVCGALDNWIGAVSAASETAIAAAPTTAAGTSKSLNALLTRTLKATAKLRSRLVAAGKPSVSGGKQVAATIREGFRQVESSLKGAKRSLAAAPASDPAAFTAAARASQDALEAGLESIQAGFSAVRGADVDPLLAAFHAEKACQAVAG